MNKHEAAQILYNEGVKQKEIAEILTTTTTTVNRWVAAGQWDKKRAEHSIKKETAEERVWNIINYQLRIIDLMMQKHQEDNIENMEIAELKKLLIERGDIDALQKLFTTIKGKELEWSQIVKIVRELLEYIERENNGIAKQVTPLANEFINNKRTDQ